MTDLKKYNDSRTFPRKEDLVSVIMEGDGSLQIRVLRSDNEMHYHGMINCPRDTKMHDWIISMTGPMGKGQLHLFGYEEFQDQEIDLDAPNELSEFF